MKRLLIMVVLTILILQTTCYSADSVGTYQLQTVNKGDEIVLYRINTVTGDVWEYRKYAIPNSASMPELGDKAKESLDNLIREASAQGKSVYTLPYWEKTAEKVNAKIFITD